MCCPDFWPMQFIFRQEHQQGMLIWPFRLLDVRNIVNSARWPDMQILRDYLRNYLKKKKVKITLSVASISETDLWNAYYDSPLRLGRPKKNSASVPPGDWRSGNLNILVWCGSGQFILLFGVEVWHQLPPSPSARKSIVNVLRKHKEGTFSGRVCLTYCLRASSNGDRRSDLYRSSCLWIQNHLQA